MGLQINKSVELINKKLNYIPVDLRCVDYLSLKQIKLKPQMYCNVLSFN